MLLERLSYADDFPINIHVAQLKEDPLHYHIDIEILYVLKGEILLKNGYCHYHLREGDIFTNAGHEVHGMSALTEDNAVAVIQISTHYFSQYFPNLSKACYRTYSHKAEDARRETLRGLLLQLLTKYVMRSFNYKSECTYLMGDIIKHLEKYFNLFAFEQDVVVGFDRGNSVVAARISRICQYIYQYYAENITLEDLSQIEHLSPFYLSHLIKNFTGMNFRDFLCFARVEWSEIPLLGSDKKISQIAREVGFSTTAYYRKYFEKWFKDTPENHRNRFRPQIKSDLNPADYHDLPLSRVAGLIKRAHANYNLKKDSTPVIEALHLDVAVDPAAKALHPFDIALRIGVTTEDLAILGSRLLPLLDELAPHSVVILRRPEDTAEQLYTLSSLLENHSFVVEQQPRSDTEPIHAANDTIAAPIRLLHRCLDDTLASPLLCLRDSGEATKLLQGKAGLLTSGGIRKPQFFLAQALSLIKGDLICRGGSYGVIRLSPDTFFLFLYHGAKAMDALFSAPADLQALKSALNEFKDELSISAQFHVKSGIYFVVKYCLNRSSSLFSHLAALDFPAAPLSTALAQTLSSPPTADAYTEDVRTAFQVALSIKGAGIHGALIRKKPSL